MRAIYIAAGAAGGVLGGAMVLLPIYFATGQNEVLSFIGSVLGSAVTAISIIAAWQLGIRQTARQQDIANWNAAFDFQKQLSADKPDLYDTLTFVLKIDSIMNNCNIQDKDRFEYIANSQFGVDSSILRDNIVSLINYRIPNAPPFIKIKLKEIFHFLMSISVNNIDDHFEKIDGTRTITNISEARSEALLLVTRISTMIGHIDSFEQVVSAWRNKILERAANSIRSAD